MLVGGRGESVIEVLLQLMTAWFVVCRVFS